MTQTPEKRLDTLTLSLSRIVKPAGNLLGYKVHRGQIYVTGQLPLEDGVMKYVGKVGDTVSKDEAYEAAKLAALNVVSQLSLAVGGDLSRIEGIVKVSGFVNCLPNFTDIAAVINGASDLFINVFGDLGTHARFAVGVGSLPRGVPVEVEVIARLRDKG